MTITITKIKLLVTWLIVLSLVQLTTTWSLYAAHMRCVDLEVKVFGLEDKLMMLQQGRLPKLPVSEDDEPKIPLVVQ